MYNKKSLALSAISKAMLKRLELGIQDDTPINIYNVIEESNIDLWFVDIPSMEGVYYKDEKPTILISSHRPKGRKVFTAAHEFAHFIYNHSSKIDELKKTSSSFQPEEYIADVFAGEFLMPKTAIIKYFKERKWDLNDANPIQYFTCSNNFGVGYETLLTQINTYNLVNENIIKNLLKLKLSQIKFQIINENIGSDLLIVDNKSKNNIADCETNDFLVCPLKSIIQGSSFQRYKELDDKIIYQAIKPGINLLINEFNNLSKFIRVQKINFNGRNKFRHLEEE